MLAAGACFYDIYAQSHHLCHYYVESVALERLPIEFLGMELGRGQSNFHFNLFDTIMVDIGMFLAILLSK